MVRSSVSYIGETVTVSAENPEAVATATCMGSDRLVPMRAWK